MSKNNYKESIKTLRPKEFVRERQLYDSLTAKEQYFFSARHNLQSGTFNEIDRRSQLHEYEM